MRTTKTGMFAAILAVLFAVGFGLERARARDA